MQEEDVYLFIVSNFNPNNVRIQPQILLIHLVYLTNHDLTIGRPIMFATIMNRIAVSVTVVIPSIHRKPVDTSFGTKVVNNATKYKAALGFNTLTKNHCLRYPRFVFSGLWSI